MNHTLGVHYPVTIAVNAINYRISFEKYKADWQAAIGSAPIKPVKPAELTKPIARIKSAAPVQPTPPAKTGANKKYDSGFAVF